MTSRPFGFWRVWTNANQLRPWPRWSMSSRRRIAHPTGSWRRSRSAPPRAVGLAQGRRSTRPLDSLAVSPLSPRSASGRVSFACRAPCGLRLLALSDRAGQAQEARVSRDWPRSGESLDMTKAAVSLAAASVLSLGALSLPGAAEAQPYAYPPERVEWTVGPGFSGFSGYPWPGPPFA